MTPGILMNSRTEVELTLRQILLGSIWEHMDSLMFSGKTLIQLKLRFYFNQAHQCKLRLDSNLQTSRFIQQHLLNNHMLGITLRVLETQLRPKRDQLPAIRIMNILWTIISWNHLKVLKLDNHNHQLEIQMLEGL